MATVGMVRADTTGAAIFFISAFITILNTRGTRAQKGDGCGYTVLGTNSGTLSSINYPQTYPNHTVCEWEIRVSPGKRIHFKFGDFDIEDLDSCHFNYLRIYNGIGTTRSEIGKHCGLGLKLDDLIESSVNEVTVQFMSGMHRSGRGFFLSYSTTDHTDLITCLDKGIYFSDPEFSKYCPAGCRTSFGEISGTIPHGYRDSSLVCMAGIHAGVVSNVLGGQINVVSSKGIPYYESSLANNVTSVVGSLSNSLFTFKTSGCYGTLGLEAGVVRDSQISSSSVWEWTDVNGQLNVWAPTGARLKKPSIPWSASHSDQRQWLQVDLKKEKRITGIITTGSTLKDYYYYVSAYRVLYSHDGQHWDVYREANTDQDKIFQGNANYLQEVRNNFIPPIEARFLRINPVQWHQRIAMKIELLGCQPHTGRAAAPRLPPKISTDFPLQYGKTTLTPDVRNTTMTPNSKDVALAAVLVPVLVMAVSGFVLVMVCAWHWRNRKKSAEGTYDLPHWDRTGWWKGMKQFLPTKGSEAEESPVRYSSSEVSRLRGREGAPVLQAEPAEYAQPLVGGIVGTLGQRSTFKPEEGSDPGYTEPDPYDAPLQEIYHAYAQPLPASGAEYATPIILDIAGHSASGTLSQVPISTFKARGPASVLSRTDSSPSSGHAQYDTPKGTSGQGPTLDEYVYQVPQNNVQKAADNG